jgi:hypothetical protein
VVRRAGVGGITIVIRIAISIEAFEAIARTLETVS